MKILILGAGQVGTTAAYSLAREEANEVTIVDRNPDKLREFQERLDARPVLGHAAHPDVLERAGAGEAEMIIALTNSDEITWWPARWPEACSKRRARSQESALASTPCTARCSGPTAYRWISSSARRNWSRPI